MYQTHFYPKPSPFLVFKAGLAEHLHIFVSNIDNWFIESIIKDFNKMEVSVQNELNEVDNLDPNVAKQILLVVQKDLPSFERLELVVSKVSNQKLNLNFKSLKKTIYKYEAKLHKIAFSNDPIAETPEYIKTNLSELSKSIKF